MDEAGVSHMDAEEFKKEFLEEVKSAAAVSGEGTAAEFAGHMADYLIDTEVLSNFNPAYCKSQKGNRHFRTDGYVFDELDGTMNLIIVDYDDAAAEGGETHRMTKSAAETLFQRLRTAADLSIHTDLYEMVEPSTPFSDLVEFLRYNVKNIRKYRFFIFTNKELSAQLKTITIDDFDGVPVEGQVWNLDRLFRVCCSEQGRQVIEIDFREYSPDGIPCLEASSAATAQYRSYLGVIPGEMLADIYDKYGSRLLEGNVRSFLSTKVAVNKQIRNTILNDRTMFFAFNNGISATALTVEVVNTARGRFIVKAKDFQIINGGQTTASIASARYKDKAKLDGLYVQMKLTAIDESSPEEADALIRKISRSSNSQNKVSDADFFASHPFHRRMEQISRMLFAPPEEGAQYETKWFYERARGQYLQEQMRMTRAKQKQFQLQNPKQKVIKKTDLAKVQNAWLGNPQVVSKGAQTNFNRFAEWLEDQWDKNEAQFNDLYFKQTASLMLMFQYMEKRIPQCSWYRGGYRANIVCYTAAVLRKIIRKQFHGADLDLMKIWNRQAVPEPIGTVLLELAEQVAQIITDPQRGVINVTQWCKRDACWEAVQTRASVVLPAEFEQYLLAAGEKKDAERTAKKQQKMTNEINAQVEVYNKGSGFWKQLSIFVVQEHLASPLDVSALKAACSMPAKVPNVPQSRRLLALLAKAEEEGFAAHL